MVYFLYFYLCCSVSFIFILSIIVISMLGWIIQTSIFSIAIIFLVHHIIYFLKNSLTVPKVKDLVSLPSKKYQDILNTIRNVEEETSTLKNVDNIQEIDVTDIQSLPTEENHSMKNELKNFLKKQLQDDTLSISSIEPTENKSSFSEVEMFSNDNNQYAPF